MNLKIALTTLVILTLGCVVARVMSQRTGGTSKDISLALGLLSGTGVLLAMGSIEMAGRYGNSVILALIAFSLVFVCSPVIFVPVRRLSEIIRFATPVDFLTFRYRTKSVAVIACIALILAVIPLILAQFVAIEAIAKSLFGNLPTLVTLLLATAIILMINLRSIKIGAANHLAWIMAAAGLLLLPALGFSAWVALTSAFGGLTEMNGWVIDSGQRFIVQRMDFSYSLFIIFLAAGFAYPINFSLLISDDISDRQAGMTSWVYPMLILLASIPIFPLLWSGISVQSASPLQDYLFTLPTLGESPIIASLASASILLLGISLTCSLSLIIARIALNSFYLPSKELQKQSGLNQWIEQRQMLIATSLVTLCVCLSMTTKYHSITDYYLASFAGLAQLTPGMLAVIYLPKVSRQGFIAGLIAGLSVWLITILLPLLFGDWSWQPPFSEKTIYFGMQNWEIWAIEALLLNITICTLFSLHNTMDKEQQAFATVCMADNIYIPARVEIAQKSVSELTDSLRLSLGDAAENEVSQALDNLGYDTNEVRPAALRQLRDRINASLNMGFGVLAANRIMEKSLPLSMPAANEPDDIHLIESVLAIQGDRLTGIASELNKLRVHHRQILDNLPIGVVSLDEGGEIVRWNSTLASYTGISQTTATGSLIQDLPEPWCSAISDFINSSDNSLDDLRLEIESEIRWYSLQKSIQQDKLEQLEPDLNREVNRDVNIEPSADIVLLIEDQTEAVNLIQNSIDNERLASVGRLAAGVAHEIGNPVTGIACIAQNLEHETESGQVAESAQQILSQTHRINRIVQSLINFSRGGNALASNQQNVSLSNAAAEAIQLLTLSEEQQNLQFVCDIDPNLSISGDYHQLLQVFLNLLSNARDASPDGGSISIHAVSTEREIQVDISDQGIGIEENVRSRLFEPFVTTKDPGKGTGLGLWIVFNLVKSLGAEVALASPAVNSDRGTTVTIRFPVSSIL
ncbi:MAG: ATP-binding protein [Porticoccaceae bacterium]|nr:ATP-binding protein [Porticoccaceae bacterium]